MPTSCIAYTSGDCHRLSANPLSLSPGIFTVQFFCSVEVSLVDIVTVHPMPVDDFTVKCEICACMANETGSNLHTQS